MKRIELTKFRTNNSKQFLNDDKTITVELYNENVHYLKDGKYVEINNKIYEDEDCYYNKENDFLVKFPKSNKGELLNINYKKYDISFNIDNRNESEAIYNLFDSRYNLNIGVIRYLDMLENIDVEYEIHPNKLKENIIIKDKNINTKLVFSIKSKLKLELNKDNSISFIDKEEVFKIDRPYLKDMNNDINDNIICNLVKDKDDYQIELILDEKWLNDNKRVFPIVLDPSIKGSDQGNIIHDTYIYSGDNNDTVYNTDILKFGIDKVNNVNRVYRTLLKFDLPTIPTSYSLVKANLNMVGYGDTTYSEIDSNSFACIHRITNDWVESTAKWSNMNDKYNSKIESIFYATRSAAVIANNMVTRTPKV